MMRCPNNPNHKEFFTVAHVVETWKVDEEGNYLETISTDETTHRPDPDNTWTCVACNTEATKASA